MAAPGTPEWLLRLSSHPIFSLHKSPRRLSNAPPKRFPQSAALSPIERPHSYGSGDTHDASQKPQICVNKQITALVNNTDLVVVAGGRELRMASLTSAKSAYTSNDRENEPDYKELVPKDLNGLPVDEIVRILPNPSGRLLAVASANEISVVTLPINSISAAASTISVEVFPLGRSHKSTGAISKRRKGDLQRGSPIVDFFWHPWGSQGNVLLVLTGDGKCHEFDVLDPQNPCQIIDLRRDDPVEDVPQSPTRTGKAKGRDVSTALVSQRLASVPTYNASSDGGAVSMTLGRGHGDWGPLTLYSLMQNGDVYAYCPYLPKSCVAPASYIQSLSFFLSTKLSVVNSTDYPSELPTVSTTVKTNLNRSLDFLNDLVQQLPSASDDDDERESGSNDTINTKTDDNDDWVTIKPPSGPDFARPRLQGPILCQPSPHEVSEFEACASCITYVSLSSSNDKIQSIIDAGLRSSLGLLLVTYADKVDVCWEVEKPEAAFSNPFVYAQVEEEEELEPPIFSVWETIHLGLQVDEEEEAHSTCKWMCVPDATNEDIFYLFGRLGVWALDVSPWSREVAKLIDSSASIVAREGENNAVIGAADVLRSLPGTEVVQVIDSSHDEGIDVGVVGLVIVSDAYLDTCLLAINHRLELAAFELCQSPVVTSVSDPTRQSVASNQLTNVPQAYTTLLQTEDGKPWSIPSGLQKSHSNLTIPIPPSLSTSNAMLTSTTFKQGVQLTSSIHQLVISIVESTNQSQHRHKLQVEEFKRQLESLHYLQRNQMSLSSHSDVSLNRIEQVSNRQVELCKRFDSVLQQLIKLSTKEVGVKEKSWFKELERWKLQMGRQNGDTSETFQGRFNKLKKHVEFVKVQLQSLILSKQRQPLQHFVPSIPTTLSSSMLGKIGKSQLSTIEHALEIEAKLIDRTTNRTCAVADIYNSLSNSQDQIKI